MKDRESGAKLNRRSFLKGAAVVGGAATVAAVGQGVVADTRPEPEAAREEPRSRGYQETPHIRAYYEKARF